MTAPISNKMWLAGSLIFGAESGGWICDIYDFSDSRGQDSGICSNFLFGTQQVMDVPIVGRGVCAIFGQGPWAGRQSIPAGDASERYPGVAYYDGVTPQHCLPCLDIKLAADLSYGYNFFWGTALGDLSHYKRGDWTAGKAITGRIIFRGAATAITGIVRVTAGRNTDATAYPTGGYTENGTNTVVMTTPLGIRSVDALCGSGAGSPTIALIEPASHADETGKTCQIPLVYFWEPAATGGVRLTAIATSTFTTVDLFSSIGGGVSPKCSQDDAVAFFQKASPPAGSRIRRVRIVDLGTNRTAAETTDFNAGGHSVYKTNVRNFVDQCNIVDIAAFGSVAEALWLRTPFVSKGGSTEIAALQALALFEISQEVANVCYDNFSGRITATHHDDESGRGAYSGLATEDDVHVTGKASAHPGGGDIVWALSACAAAQQASQRERSLVRIGSGSGGYR